MRQTRPSDSQAISVEPLPPNVSRTMSPGLLLLTIARETSSTGFIVGCSVLRFGRGISHTVSWVRSLAQAWAAPGFQP